MILDLCRLDRQRTARRLGSEPMDDILDRALRSPPDGVEVWSACVSGQGSLTDDVAGGSLFFEQLFLALEGPAGTQVPLGVQLADDSFPISKLAGGDSGCPGVNRGTEDEAKRRFKVRQTPRLAGVEKPTFEKFDRREAAPLRVAIDWSPSRAASVRTLHRVAMALDTHQTMAPDEFRGDIDGFKKRSRRCSRNLRSPVWNCRKRWRSWSSPRTSRPRRMRKHGSWRISTRRRG